MNRSNNEQERNEQDCNEQERNERKRIDEEHNEQERNEAQRTGAQFSGPSSESLLRQPTCLLLQRLQEVYSRHLRISSGSTQ